MDTYVNIYIYIYLLNQFLNLVELNRIWMRIYRKFPPILWNELGKEIRNRKLAEIRSFPPII